MALHLPTPPHIHANEFAPRIGALVHEVLPEPNVDIALYGEFIAIRNVPPHDVDALVAAVSARWPDILVVNTDDFQRAA